MRIRTKLGIARGFLIGVAAAAAAATIARSDAQDFPESSRDHRLKTTDPKWVATIMERVGSAVSLRKFQAPEFKPPPLMGGPTRQSVLGAMVKKAECTMKRERVELSDGDFVDIDYMDTKYLRWEDAEPGAPICLLIHGLGGSSSSGYVMQMACCLGERGIRAVAINLRGTTGANRRPVLYNAGAVDDPHEVLVRLAKEHPTAPLALVGFSLGAAITLNYAIRKAPLPDLQGRLVACVAISPPLDLLAGSEVLKPGQMWNTYLLNGIKKLIKPLEATIRAAAIPGVDFDKAAKAESVKMFDDNLTAPMHGYKDAVEYYTGPRLPEIQTPTLIIRSRDDPFLARVDCDFPGLTENPMIHSVITDLGGHIGFVEYRNGVLQAWAEPVAADWLSDRFKGDEDIHHTTTEPPSPSATPAAEQGEPIFD